MSGACGGGKQIQGWFFRLKRIGYDRGQDVDNPLAGTAVPSVFHLAPIFQLIVDALDQRPLTEQELIDHRHEFVVPVALEFGEQLQTVCPQLLEPFLADVATIAEPFAPEWADQLGDGTAILDLSRCECEAEPFTLLVDDQMQLEALEPTHAAFATLRQPGKDLV